MANKEELNELIDELVTEIDGRKNGDGPRIMPAPYPALIAVLRAIVKEMPDKA